MTEVPAPPLRRSLMWRRIGFAALVVVTAAGMIVLMAVTLFPRGVDVLGLAMLAAFVLTVPWSVIGFWNAVIGLGILICARDPAAAVAPDLIQPGGDDPVTASTALVVCVRNEDPRRLERNLAWMMAGLAQRAERAFFHVYVLSDSNRPELAAAECVLADTLARRFGAALPITYRRREQSVGFKAGNIRDFCERWGDRHTFAIVLDADSLMTPEAMLRMVRIMQRHPRLGILQSLVTGMPSLSAFARVFQFGMRLGMRSHTIGAAAWQGDCGPYWGHNAIIRLDPFIRDCELPRLSGGPPLGGVILSHDQVEAVLMRRAGYEVRVLAEEGGSWEENPPALTEFIRRDLRWCHGNMQYLRLLALPGLRVMSRCQLLLAIAMYMSPLGWIAFLLLGALRSIPIREETGYVLFAAAMLMTFAPKFATLADVLVRARLRAAFGGTARLLLGAAIEIVFWTLIAPACALAVTLFLLGLPFGRQIGWSSQQRDVDGLPFADAARRLWPQTLLGIVMLAWLVTHTPGTIWWLALPVYVGLATCIPVAVLTAHPAIGRVFARAGICRIPEEAPPEVDVRLPRPFATRAAVAAERAR